jgi:MoxR-like ATPase
MLQKDAIEQLTPSHDQTLEAPDLEVAETIRTVFGNLKSELSRVIVGLDEEINQIFITLLCRGHCILEGAPGLAKTKLISSVASLLDLSFRRVQFTPDLMPGDLTGSEVLQQDMETGERFFRFHKGPLFANLVLADEVNRTPPKTQSSLLEAMEERQITVGQTTYPLPKLFFGFIATNNMKSSVTIVDRGAVYAKQIPIESANAHRPGSKRSAANPGICRGSPL